MEPIAALFDWLVDGAPGTSSAAEVIGRMGKELRLAGIPLERMSAFVTTLHPHIMGRAFFWTKDQPVRVGELTRELEQSASYQNSPIAETINHRVELRYRLREGTRPTDYPIIHQLASEGFTDYLCLPMVFTTGHAHVISFATTCALGFTEAEIAMLRRVVRPLARVAEILALRRTAANLLSTYVGRNSGERILAGRIYRGDLETIRAVIWFSDLRGFTELSGRLSSRAIIDTLNELFECQVPAIERHGGEVLKFIGDGLLAIFPIDGPLDAPLDRSSDAPTEPPLAHPRDSPMERPSDVPTERPSGSPSSSPSERPAVGSAAGKHSASARCTDALAAADDAFAALAQRNQSAAQQIQFGLALHVGEIAYGNIGSASRLDFTVIGSAVNIAARLEGLTSKLGRLQVVSAEFAQHATRPLVDLGEFVLKGVAGTQRVFAPARLG